MSSKDYMNDIFEDFFPGMFDFWNRAVPASWNWTQGRKDMINKVANNGLKAIIGRPHDLWVAKDKDGNTVYRIQLCYTPFSKDEVQVEVSDKFLEVRVGMGCDEPAIDDDDIKNMASEVEQEDLKKVAKQVNEESNDNGKVKESLKDDKTQSPSFKALVNSIRGRRFNDDEVAMLRDVLTPALEKDNYKVEFTRTLPEAVSTDEMGKAIYHGISRKPFWFKLYLKNLLDWQCDEEIDIPNIKAHANDGMLELTIPTKKKQPEGSGGKLIPVL